MALQINEQIYKLVLDKVYPVGSIYISTTSTNPSTIFGGTWAQISQGRCLVGVGTATGQDGGKLSVTNGQSFGYTNHAHTTGDCTLTVDQMPSHTHVQDPHTHAQHKSTWINVKGDSYIGHASGYYATADVGANYNVSSVTATNQETGGGQAHNHGATGNASTYQPSFGVYMWQRTA